jgi:hypothetical protein
MKAKIKISMHDLIEAIMESNPKMRPKSIRKYIIENLILEDDGYIQLDLTFEKPEGK